MTIKCSLHYFVCCITNYHTFNGLKNTHSLFHGSVSHISGMTHQGSLLKISQSQKKDVKWAGLSCRCSGKRDHFQLIQPIGRIQFLIVYRLEVLVSLVVIRLEVFSAHIPSLMAISILKASRLTMSLTSLPSATS